MKQPPSRPGEYPVRKVGKNHRSVTGALASSKAPPASRYESALERDFYVRLDFDPRVSRYIPQPVVIPSPDRPRVRPYTPDTLVHYTDGRPPGLFEVKYVAEVQEKRDVLRVKFRLGRAYAREQGWTFSLITERTIRQASLQNIAFLRPFARRTFPDALKTEVLVSLDTPQTIEQLLAHFSPGDRPHLLPVVWHLLATFLIETDLDTPIHLKSIIQVRGGT